MAPPLGSPSIIIVGALCLTLLACAGLATGNPSIAYTAAGALAGLLAGHLNGRQVPPV